MLLDLKKQTLTYQVDQSLPFDAAYPLNLFLSHWLTIQCQGRFTMSEIPEQHVIGVQFDVAEDATFVKLRGLSSELSKYLAVNE